MSAAKHTAGPWVGFSDGGKTVAIMPAGRPADICTFAVSPSDADANVMIAAPDLLDACAVLSGWILNLPLSVKLSQRDSRAGRAAYSKAQAAMRKAVPS